MLTIPVTTTGGDAAATGTGTLPHKLPKGSFITAIYVDYHASAPATTDVTITDDANPDQPILTLTDKNTDAWYYPTHAMHDNTGVDTGQRGLFMSEGAISVAVAGCNALAPAVTVYIQTMRNVDIE